MNKHFGFFASVLSIVIILLNYTLSLSQDPQVPLKNWPEYSDWDKSHLRSRWTPEKTKLVLQSLKDNSIMPEFVHVSARHEKTMPTSGADLRCISLAGKDLSRCAIQGLDAQGGAFWRCVMSQTFFTRSNLQGSSFQQAKMENTFFRDSDLRYTDFTMATLKNIDFRGTDVEGADFFGVYMDAPSVSFVDFGKAKNIRYIKWGDSLESRYLIAEEFNIQTVIDADKSRTDIERVFRIAESTYRDLASFYEQEGLHSVALEFRYRENEIVTDRLLHFRQNPYDYALGALRVIFLKWTFGYGSRPIWLLRYAVVVILFFSIIYAGMTLVASDAYPRSGIGIKTEHGNLIKLKFEKWKLVRRCLYFSLLTFATFGYGAIKPKQWLQLFQPTPIEYKPILWTRLFVGVEAASGIWVFALMVYVLFGHS